VLYNENKIERALHWVACRAPVFLFLTLIPIINWVNVRNKNRRAASHPMQRTLCY